MATLQGTKENLEDLVLGNDIVLIDFWAEWCGPCKVFGPVFEEASERHPDVTFIKVDTEAEPELAAAFGVRAIPMLVAFREGVGMVSSAGAVSAESLNELISRIRALDMEEVRAEMNQRQQEPGEASDD